ncbi:hypothetical protein Pcinc_030706 [Petrolisthes cinctipes]|uniref:Endonuclease/exonuclease/phosphatase domain-containing protein n=1 Tax=Petrolisthes cinctipes TaxID=88211 RepID=A0AAE1K276_PETCI|nr:hypothetical protein Pcinc_030706 [Petrolisthes cinctipes]
MSSCMSCCWLPTRVLYSAANLAACRGSHTAARDGTQRFLSISSVLHSTSGNHLDAQTDTNASETTSDCTSSFSCPESEVIGQQESEQTSRHKSDHVSQHRKSKQHIHQQPSSSGIKHLPPQPNHHHLKPPTKFDLIQRSVHRTLLDDDAQCCNHDQSLLTDNKRLKLPGEMTSKRTQDVLSPTRPTATKKKKNGGTTTSLDVIPLPPNSPPKEQQQQKEGMTASLDFIPLPPNSPTKQQQQQQQNEGMMATLDFIPLPPNSPPKQQQQPEDNDTSNDLGSLRGNITSEVVFTAAVVPSKSVDKADPSSSGRKDLNDSGSSDTNQVENIIISSSPSSCSSHNNNKNGFCVKMDRKPSDDDIEILSFTCGDGGSRDKYSSSSRSRKCKFIGTSDSQMALGDDDIDVVFEKLKEAEEDEVVMVEERKKGSQSPKSRPTTGLNLSTAASLSSIPLPTSNPNSRRQPSRQCYTSTSQGLKPKSREEEEEEEVVEEEEEEEAQQSKVQIGDKKNQRETKSPGIEKVNVIDPDVLEIESQPGCSSGSNRKGVEVIDIFNSDSESDNQSIASSSKDDEGDKIDVSGEDFVSLNKLRVADLHNTEIDLSDATLDMRRRLEKMRRWDMTGLGQCMMAGLNMKPTDTFFTVMCYNVLAQSLLQDNNNLYKSCDDEHLTWSYRWALLQHEISGINPDILMLQEVQASHYHSHYLPWFTYLGYDGLFKKRTGLKSDGCAIFYKRSKFSLLEHCSVEYLQPQTSNLLDRDNIALIAKFSSVSQPDAPPLCVATTHLLYNPKRHDIKLAQAVLLLTELDRLCYQGEEGGRPNYCPLLVTGDFNAEPHSTLIGFLMAGRIQYEGLSRRTLARYGSFDSLLDSCLLPPSLGITDRCQHSVLAQGRFTENVHGGPIFRLSDKRSLEENLIRINHSDRFQQKDASKKSQDHSLGGVYGPRQSGWFSHGFNFKSVYSHQGRGGRPPEVTTHHSNWTTVDYMFYNRVYSTAQATSVEGKLKLLARYRLLTGPEASRFGPLPSAVCPSDHFPLAAQFLLRR